MSSNHNAGRGSSIAPPQPQPASGPQAGEPIMSWEELGSQRFQPKGRRRHILTLLSILFLLTLIFAGIRLGVVLSGTNDQLQIHVGDQQDALIDLRQSEPVSPQMRGVNVFPVLNSQSADGDFTGSMSYTTKMANDMKRMKMGLLRFPGGDKGEQIVLSYQQLGQFAGMLKDTNAEGMLQAHLGGPIKGHPQDLKNDVLSRAQLAGQWVNFMNNQKSAQRSGDLKNAPFHEVKYWSVGNEPDAAAQKNPVTGKPYTVSEYVDAFIQFSLQMHQNDPRIMVFGPELSHFDGIGVGPRDSDKQLWMEQFLKGIADWENNPQNKAQLQSMHINHLLDGVSFHHYPMKDGDQPNLLLSSTNEWNYMLPQLRDTIRQTLGHDLPISISEINTNAAGQVPSRGQAALWWADTLGTLMNQHVEYVSFFSASGVEQPHPLFSGDGLHDTQMERAMETFASLQDNVIPLSIQRDPIGVYATQDTGHQTVSVLFVNKSNHVQAAQVRSVNDIFGVSPWHSLNITLASYSVTVITLHRDGSNAEARSFLAPFVDDNKVNEVQYTLCGNKADVLDPNTPC